MRKLMNDQMDDAGDGWSSSSGLRGRKVMMMGPRDVCDEEETAIWQFERRAFLAAIQFAVAGVVLVAAIAVVWFVFGPETSGSWSFSLPDRFEPALAFAVSARSGARSQLRSDRGSPVRLDPLLRLQARVEEGDCSVFYPGSTECSWTRRWHDRNLREPLDLLREGGEGPARKDVWVLSAGADGRRGVRRS